MSLNDHGVRIPELHKKQGVCYAVTNDGIELPVIDVEHAAFHLELGADGEAAGIQDVKRPSFFQKLLIKPMLRGSLLAQSIAQARGNYVTGMGTYLLKLGPGNLGNGYAKKIDFAIASSLPCTSARLRLRNTAQLLADALVDALSGRNKGGSLFLFNIAGGPASDSLNALMMVYRKHPDLLAGVRIELDILDMNSDGPAFARRSLAALSAEGGPLSGLSVELNHCVYDWNDAAALQLVLRRVDAARDCVVISSEGGLFEYASDRAISANLDALRPMVPEDAVFVGSLGKAHGKERLINEATGTSAKFRDFEALRELFCKSGWNVDRILDCPLSYCMAIRKTLR